jgi:hypothetical protein
MLSLGSATPTPTATPLPVRPLPCAGSEFQQFDFWLGNWKVTNPYGKHVGTSEISRAAEGCAIREQWKSPSGGSGMSINYFDPDDRKWHQDWVGGDGAILHLQGELVGNAMVLRGSSKAPNGTVINRIIWTPLPDGKVKQEWSTSDDDGRNWKISFVGIYEKTMMAESANHSK